MKITTVWAGMKVVDDGTEHGSLSFLAKDGYLALQRADWMELIDEDGWPRTTKPGDVWWTPYPVYGIDITLRNGVLTASTNDGLRVEITNVDLSSVLPATDPLVAAVIAALQPPPEEYQSPRGSITGIFGMGGSN